jgi:hypothetical protein
MNGNIVDRGRIYAVVVIVFGATGTIYRSST